MLKVPHYLLVSIAIAFVISLKQIKDLLQQIFFYLSMQLDPVDCPKIPHDFHLKLRTRFLKKLLESGVTALKTLSLFKGISTLHKNYDDNDYLPEQQSTFWYLFGVREADCLALIHHDTGKSVLFVPFLDENYQLWMVVKTPEELKQEYNVDEVRYVHELREYLQQNNSTVYLFSGVDSDSGLSVEEPSAEYLEGFNVDRTTLWPLISNLRAVKTPDEIEILRYVCRVTTEAEKIAARSAKVGLTQVQLHSVFHFQHSVKSGSIQLGFNSICSSGRDCATLHYVDNDKLIQQGQMVLLDLGGKWYGYVADQAMTFPVSGKFTQKQRQIYTAVFEAQAEVRAAVKPGVMWGDMHLLAERVLLKHLVQLGIVNQFPLEELVEKRIGAVFFPHGLGHLFGLKVHDVGGYTEGPARSQLAGLSKLRTRRMLQQGICITVEPGIYFIDFMIKKALSDPNKSPYLNPSKIQEYMQVGGVRLQDDIVITSNGCQLLSSLPRTVQQVEQLLQKK